MLSTISTSLKLLDILFYQYTLRQ